MEASTSFFFFDFAADGVIMGRNSAGTNVVSSIIAGNRLAAEGAAGTASEILKVLVVDAVLGGFEESVTVARM